MLRTLFKAKIHRATVTEADLNYIGSITIDKDLMDAVGIVTSEKVQVINITTGARIETYAIPGEPGSGEICLNGGAARLFHPGDRVIIISYVLVAEEELADFKSTVLVVDEDNRPERFITYRPESPSPLPTMD